MIGMDTGLTVLDLVDDFFFLVAVKDCRLLFCHHEAMVFKSDALVLRLS